MQVDLPAFLLTMHRHPGFCPGILYWWPKFLCCVLLKSLCVILEYNIIIYSSVKHSKIVLIGFQRALAYWTTADQCGQNRGHWSVSLVGHFRMMVSEGLHCFLGCVRVCTCVCLYYVIGCTCVLVSRDVLKRVFWVLVCVYLCVHMLTYVFKTCMLVYLRGFPGALPACVFMYVINCACVLVNGSV